MIDVKLAGIGNFIQAVDAYEQDVKVSTGERVELAVAKIHGNVVRAIQAPSAGIKYKNHTASKAGDAPNTDSGALASSMTPQFDPSGLEGKVFTKLNYAPHLEFGTINMQARPSLQPALDKWVKESKNKKWEV